MLLFVVAVICNLPPNCWDYILKPIQHISLYKNFQCYLDIGIILKTSKHTRTNRKKQDVTEENHKMVEMFMIGVQGKETPKKVWA